MDVLDRNTITSLAGHQGWPSISIFLPTHTLPRQTAEDRIRPKNLIRDAGEQLAAEGMRAADADSFCDPARRMLEDDTFWRDAAAGLAIFISEDEVRTLKLDISLPEQVITGDRYSLRALLPAYRPLQEYFALALDKNRTRLFKGDRRGIEEVPLEETFTTFEEAMKFDDATRNLTTHSFMAGRVASRGNQHEGSNYAGYGGEKDVDVEQTIRFARLIERGVAEAVGTSALPLLLLGNERLLSAYRDVNTYANMADTQVTGASDYLSPLQIQQTAMEVLAPHFDGEIEADLRELNEREGSALASHDPKDIVTAAATGRVKTLFFDDGEGPFGLIDRDTLQVTRLCSGSPRFLRETSDPQQVAANGDCGWDLVDLAAAETALHGGEIRAFTGEDVPVHGVAAVYRY